VLRSGQDIFGKILVRIFFCNSPVQKQVNGRDLSAALIDMVNLSVAVSPSNIIGLLFFGPDFNSFNVNSKDKTL
jgi:hypothetical protein